MLFTYRAIEKDGSQSDGTIEAINVDVAISSLQRRGLIISSINSNEKQPNILSGFFSGFTHISNREIVILSRQMATLFEAQVSALQIFKLMAGESENVNLRVRLAQIADDLQGGNSISKALSKHPQVFSSFYISMVKAGEESGKLNDSFMMLADYLEHSYEVTSKVKNALIYPAFVIFTFVVVMILMLTKVIPSISQILVDSGQEVPIYTKVVIALSAFLVNYGLFLLVGVIVGGFFLVRWLRTPSGKMSLSRFKIELPYIGDLYRKLYLSRISSNLFTMLVSAIPIVRAVEITADVVDNVIYEEILKDSSESIKAGSSLSQALSKHEEMPGILIQMVRVGEETGELGSILKTLSRFYEREVTNAVDTLVGLIEPVMIVMLGLGVGFLLASVLIPIYNISAGIS